MKQKQQEKINNTMRTYHRNGTTSKCILNHVSISSANHIEHELSKCIIGIILSNGGLLDPNWNKIKKAVYAACDILEDIEIDKSEVKHFITEAVDISSNKRRDLVILETGEVIEVMYKHKNKEIYDEYKKDNVTCYEL